jgi:hypothetical protein
MLFSSPICTTHHPPRGRPPALAGCRCTNQPGLAAPAPLPARTNLLPNDRTSISRSRPPIKWRVWGRRAKSPSSNRVPSLTQPRQSSPGTPAIPPGSPKGSSFQRGSILRPPHILLTCRVERMSAPTRVGLWWPDTTPQLTLANTLQVREVSLQPPLVSPV